MKQKIAIMLATLMLLTSVFPTMTSLAANDESTATTYSASALQASAQRRYNEVMAAGVKKIEYSENWYENVTPVELGARLIYAEAPFWKADKQAVAWVMWYRRADNTGDFKDVNTLYDVIVQSGQFATITGGASPSLTEEERKANTKAAREVDVTTQSWQNALMYACIIWAAAAEGYNPALVLPIPTGYTNQMYFCAFWSFFQSDTYDTNDGPVKDYKPIKQIFIPVHGGFLTVAEAQRVYYNENNLSLELPYPKDKECVNVFYNWGR